MFTSLLVFVVALSSATCNTTIVGVRLLLPERPRDLAAACELLRSRSLARWREGAFGCCIFKHAGETFVGNFVISYSITVNPAKFPEFPMNESYASKAAFINKQLNVNGSDCPTVAGSNWGKPMPDIGIKREIEFYLKTRVNDSTPVTCNTINERLRLVSKRLQKFGCFHEQLPSAVHNLHQHRFILKVQVTTVDDRIPPTQNLLNAVIHTLAARKAVAHNCIRVTNARYNATRSIWSFELYVSSDHKGTSACQFLIARIGDWPVTCYPLENSNRQHNESEQRVQLNIAVNDLDQSATTMDRVEAALRLHFQLNDGFADCVVVKVDQFKEAFERVPYKGYYSAVVSGPFGKYFCQMATAMFAYTAHSCEVVRHPLKEGDSGVYRLRPKEPFYLLDLPWFMNKHHEFVGQLNRKNSRCDFNGYIRLDRNDPIY